MRFAKKRLPSVIRRNTDKENTKIEQTIILSLRHKIDLQSSGENPQTLSEPVSLSRSYLSLSSQA